MADWRNTLRAHCKTILAEKNGSILLSQLGTLIRTRFPDLHQQLKDNNVKLAPVLVEDDGFEIEGYGGFLSVRQKVPHEQQVIQYVVSRLKEDPTKFIKLSALGIEISQQFPTFHLQGYPSLKKFLISHSDFQISGEAGLVGVRLLSTPASVQSADVPRAEKPKATTAPPSPSVTSSKGAITPPSSQYEIQESSVELPKQYDLKASVSGNSKIYLNALFKGSEQVAVKKLLAPLPVDDQAKLQKILREVEIQGKYSTHSNICPLRGYFIKKGKLYLVTPQMKGSLRSEIQGRGRLPLSKVIRIAHGIASGVNHLHQSSNERTMHRDLNASNVLLDDNGVPKISDFGLARTASEATLCTVNNGTPSSIAPEMIDAYVTQKEYTEKVDVWGFAMILYEMLSGEVPYADLNLVGLSRLFHEEATTGKSTRPRIESITNQDNVFSKRLITLMQQCWQLEPKLRPDFKSILKSLEPLKDAVSRRHPVPEFWSLQQRLDLIAYVGDRYAKFQNDDPMVQLLEANQDAITGGDWTALLEEDILEVLDHQVKAKDRGSVVKLIREISNIKRHMNDKKTTRVTMPNLAEKVDRSFPKLVHHLFVAVKLHCSDILDQIFPVAY